MTSLLFQENKIERNFSLALQEQILIFAFKGPFKRTYDPQKKQFISFVNPNYELLNQANLYKINNMPTWNYNFDLRNREKTMIIYFILPLKIPSEYKYNLPINSLKEHVKIILMMKSNYYHDIHLYHLTKNCHIIIPNFYYKMTQDYVQKQQDIQLSTPKNIFLWKSILKFNYGYDLTI